MHNVNLNYPQQPEHKEPFQNRPLNPQQVNIATQNQNIDLGPYPRPKKGGRIRHCPFCNAKDTIKKTREMN